MNYDENLATGEEWLAHHGIVGQKWGVQNGPPYPLDESVSTGSKLKEGVKKIASDVSEKYAAYKKKKTIEKRVKKMQKAKAEKKKAAEKEAKAKEKFENEKSNATIKGDTDWAKKNVDKLSNQEIQDILNRQTKLSELNSSMSPEVAEGMAKVKKFTQQATTVANAIQAVTTTKNNISNFANAFFPDKKEDTVSTTTSTDKNKGTVTKTQVTTHPDGSKDTIITVDSINKKPDTTSTKDNTETKSGVSDRIAEALNKSKEKTEKESAEKTEKAAKEKPDSKGTGVKGDKWSKTEKEAKEEKAEKVSGTVENTDRYYENHSYTQSGAEKVKDIIDVAYTMSDVVSWTAGAVKQLSGSNQLLLEDKSIKHSLELGEDWLAHHGIAGQKWGVQNGPPYPLDPSKDYSQREKRAMNKSGVLKAGTQVKRLSTHMDEKYSDAKTERTYVNILEKDAKKYRNFYVDNLKEGSANSAYQKRKDSDKIKIAKMTMKEQEEYYKNQYKQYRKDIKNTEVFEHVYALTKDIKIADIGTWEDQKEKSIDYAIEKTFKNNKKVSESMKAQTKVYLLEDFDEYMQTKIEPPKKTDQYYEKNPEMYARDKLNYIAKKNFVEELEKAGYGGVRDVYSVGRYKGSAGETEGATIIFEPNDNLKKIKTNAVTYNTGAAVVSNMAAMATTVSSIVLPWASGIATINPALLIGAELSTVASPLTYAATQSKVRDAMGGKYIGKSVDKKVSGYSASELRSKIAYYKESGTDDSYLKRLEAELERKTK